MLISLKRPALVLVIVSSISAFAAMREFARADDYPSHPIHLIVPYAAGGAADATARVLARQIGNRTGQTIVVENRGGSAAIVGTEFVNKADPDGYTLLLGQSGPISINPAIYKRSALRPGEGFCPGLADQHLSLPHGGEPLARRQNLAGVRGARQEQARRAELRHDRRRRIQSSAHGACSISRPGSR